MDVSNGECDFSAKLFFVELHTNDFVGEPFVEESVDLGATAQFQCVHHGRTGALDWPFKILLQLLDAPVIDNLFSPREIDSLVSY